MSALEIFFFSPIMLLVQIQRHRDDNSGLEKMKFFSKDPYKTDLLNQSSLLLPDHGYGVFECLIKT